MVVCQRVIFGAMVENMPLALFHHVKPPVDSGSRLGLKRVAAHKSVAWFEQVSFQEPKEEFGHFCLRFKVPQMLKSYCDPLAILSP